MRFSENNDKIVPALVEAIGGCAPLQKDVFNSHFPNGYASIDSIMSTLREPCKANGLIVSHGLGSDGDDRRVLITRVTHSSGQWFEQLSPWIMSDRDAGNPHKVGSAWTYGRRYALVALFGLADTMHDDDGNTAAGITSEEAMRTRCAAYGVDPDGFVKYLVARAGADSYHKVHPETLSTAFDWIASNPTKAKGEAAKALCGEGVP